LKEKEYVLKEKENWLKAKNNALKEKKTVGKRIEEKNTYSLLFTKE